MSDIWFHWSPSSRRKGIQRYGLKPGMLSTDRLWRPPYICLSDSPQIAWQLSGDMPRGSEHASWDLWEVWTGKLLGYEELYFDEEPKDIKEIRVYERILKRNVWYVATRSNE